MDIWSWASHHHGKHIHLGKGGLMGRQVNSTLKSMWLCYWYPRIPAMLVLLFIPRQGATVLGRGLSFEITPMSDSDGGSMWVLKTVPNWDTVIIPFIAYTNSSYSDSTVVHDALARHTFCLPTVMEPITRQNLICIQKKSLFLTKKVQPSICLKFS